MNMERSLLPEDIDVVNIIKKTAHTMEDEKKLLGIVDNDENNIRVDNYIMKNWSPMTLSHGLPGICMLYGELQRHFKDQGFEEAGYHYLSLLVEEIKKNGFSTPSLFSGAAGVGLALDVLSNETMSYEKLIDSVDRYIILEVNSFLENNTSDLKISNFDVMEGLSGIASYLLVRKEKLQMKKLLIQVLNYFVKLVKEVEIEGHFVPGWYIKSENHFIESEIELYKKGSFNTGLSHGITGPLIILSKALIQGIEVEGQKEAILYITNFLENTCLKNNHDYMWNAMIPFEDYTKGKNAMPIFVRDAWCYGSPGIALGVLNAGIALKNNKIIDFSKEVMQGVCREIKGLNSPTICHGYAGILQILINYEELIQEEIFYEEKKKILHKILSYYDENYEYGFYDYENKGKNKYEKIATVGLLSGNTGVLLSLLSYEIGHKTNWTNAFLL